MAHVRPLSRLVPLTHSTAGGLFFTMIGYIEDPDGKERRVARRGFLGLAAAAGAAFVLAGAAPRPARGAGLFDEPAQLEPLKLDRPAAQGWRAIAGAIKPLAGIAYPGEQVAIQFSVRNEGAAPIEAIPVLEIVRVAGRFVRFEPDPDVLGGAREITALAPAGEPVRLDFPLLALAPKNDATLSWQTDPDHPFAEPGLYALVFELPRRGRQIIATFARVHPPAAEGAAAGSALVYPLDLQGPLARQLDLAKRLGFRWVRANGMPNWAAASQPNLASPFDWSRLDAWIEEFRSRGLRLITSLAGSPRQAITAANWQAGNYVHDPQHDERFGDFVEEAVARYCGADGQGPLQIIDFWHEPWEGGGGAGWKSDAPRYRALYAIVSDRARKGSRRITVGGTSSMTNTYDKFLSLRDGEAVWGPRLGVLTDRGVPPHACFGPRAGRRLIATSMELAARGGSADTLVAAATHLTAAGQRKVCPVNADGFFWENGPAGPLCAPAAAAASAFLHFTAGLDFERIVSHDRLPWLYQWGGGPRVLFILAGDRHRLSPNAVAPFDQIRADGTIRIETMDGRLQAWDQYGTPYAAEGGQFRLPCSAESVYLEAPGVPAPMVAQTVADGRIEGVTPVEFFADDFTVPLPRLKAVEVEVHNVLTHQIHGTVTVVPPSSIGLQETMVSVSLGAGATKTLSLPVTWAKPHPANAYPFTFRFASAAGKAERTEELHVHTIARGTPTVDGGLTDWAASIPVLLRTGEAPLDLAEAAWRPWETRKDVARGMAELSLMWDETHLYLAVRERARDWKPKPRLSTRRDDDYFGADDLAHTYVKDLWDALPYVGHCLQIGLRYQPFRARLAPAGVVPPRMVADDDTDTEYALWGTPDGGAELWRSAAPELGFFNFLPRCMPEGYDGVPKGAQAVVKRQGDDTIYEAAIPLADLPGLKPAPGKVIQIAFALPGSGLELGAGRSRPRTNCLTLRPTWGSRLSNDIRWGFVKD